MSGSPWAVQRDLYTVYNSIMYIYTTHDVYLLYSTHMSTYYCSYVPAGCDVGNYVWAQPSADAGHIKRRRRLITPLHYRYFILCVCVLLHPFALGYRSSKYPVVVNGISRGKNRVNNTPGSVIVYNIGIYDADQKWRFSGAAESNIFLFVRVSLRDDSNIIISVPLKMKNNKFWS